MIVSEQGEGLWIVARHVAKGKQLVALGSEAGSMVHFVLPVLPFSYWSFGRGEKFLVFLS